MRMNLTASMPNLSFPMGNATIELVGEQMAIDVVCAYQPATPDNEDGPGDAAAVKIDFVVLRAGLALHDTTNTMTLVLSAGTDLTELLPERTLESISEQVLRAVEKQP